MQKLLKKIKKSLKSTLFINEPANEAITKIDYAPANHFIIRKLSSNTN